VESKSARRNFRSNVEPEYGEIPRKIPTHLSNVNVAKIYVAQFYKIDCGTSPQSTRSGTSAGGSGGVWRIGGEGGAFHRSRSLNLVEPAAGGGHFLYYALGQLESHDLSAGRQSSANRQGCQRNDLSARDLFYPPMNLQVFHQRCRAQIVGFKGCCDKNDLGRLLSISSPPPDTLLRQQYGPVAIDERGD